MIELLKSITPEEIYRYGSWLFVFWVAQFLIKRMWSLFEGKLRNIDDNTIVNKQLNKEIISLIKDTNEIQSRLYSTIMKHDDCSRKTWIKLLHTLDKLCLLVNGHNPELIQIRAELSTLKKGKEKNE